MPKMLLCWDQRDYVRYYDGRFWYDHSTLPNFFTHSFWAERHFQMFVYQGRLFAIYPDTVHSHYMRISRWDHGSQQWVEAIRFSIGQDLRYRHANRSNVILFANRAVWLDSQSGDGSDNNYFYLNRFWFDGANYQHSRVQLREFGPQANVAFVGHPESYQYGPVTVTPYIWPWRDGILIGPRYGVGYTGYGGDGFVLWKSWGKFTPNLAHANWEGTMDWYRRVGGTTNEFCAFFENWDDAFTLTEMQQYAVCLCPWGEKVYYINLFNEVWSFDPDTNTHTKHFSQQDAPEFQVAQGQTFTVASASTNYPLNYGGGVATNHYTYPYSFGARYRIIDGNGPGQDKDVWQCERQNVHQGPCRDANGDLLSPQADGVQFKAAWGCAPTANRRYHSSTAPFVEMFVYDNKLYILQMYELNDNDYDRVGWNAPYWTMTIWDGVNPPTRHQYTTQRDEFRSFVNVALALDQDDEKLHILVTYDYNGQLHHFAYDLANNTWAWNGFAATAWWPRVLPPDGAIVFDNGDVTPDITSVTVDVPNGRVTVEYKLFSQTSESADVEVSFATQNLAIGSNTGEGWTVATRKGSEGEGLTGLAASPTGTTHTFVQDLDADMPGKDNHKLQYQVRIVNQTRS